SSMTTTSPSSGTAPTSSTSAPSPSPTTVQAGFSVVHYQSVTFQVPSNWPVYDLAQDPTRCVRYDVHAVYLGHEGSTPNCPAHLVGRTDTVRVEPLDASSEPQAAQATQSATISGQPVHVDPSGATSGTLVVSFHRLGVIAPPTFRAERLLDQQILQTFTQAIKPPTGRREQLSDSQHTIEARHSRGCARDRGGRGRLLCAAAGAADDRA